jgi:mRNA interferase RelE/StbE
MSKRHYRLILKRQPERILRRLPRDIRERIDQKLMSLVANPRPEGCLKLTGYENLYRVRVGDWRISYAVEDDQLIVLILEIAPRGGAYRTL